MLAAIYEEDFVGFFYRFRPGRNQHDALDAPGGRKLAETGELDIFFDAMLQVPGALRRGPVLEYVRGAH